MVSTERVRVPKTAELVASQLRRQIVLGELSEGDALPPEAELMEEFGVSRPTLREAFRVLESESLISIRRGSRGGARVHTPSTEVAARHAGLLLQFRGASVGDVYAARLIIEPPAAGLVAEHGTKRAKAELRKIVEEEAGLVDDPEAFAHASAVFHERLLENAGNETLAVFAGMLTDIIELHQATVVRESSDRPASVKQREAAVRSHSKLLDLIDAGRADEAEAHWRAHMEANREHFGVGASGARTLVDLFG
ncbi:MAG: GntR family transcriptional regulator [Acidimicrobiia bacterium]